MMKPPILDAAPTPHQRRDYYDRQTRRLFGLPPKPPVTSPAKLVAALLFFAFFTMWPCAAATVTGTIKDPTGTTTSLAKVQFQPLSTPLTIGASIITTTAQSAVADTNGFFTISLQPGDYTVLIGSRDRFNISVPNDSNTYNLTTLISDNLTYTYTAPPNTLQVSAATPTYLGGVNLASNTTAIVYSTTDINSILSTLQTTITNALGTTPTPTASPSAGTYYITQTVTLSDTVPTTAIYYTLDGSTPTSSSTLYTNTLSNSSTTTLKAFAKRYLRPDSGVLTATYTIGSLSTVYYGKSTSSTLNASAVQALSSTVSASAFGRTYSFSAGSGYCYFAWPDSFGSPRSSDGFYQAPFPASMAASGDGYSGTTVNGWTYQTVTISGTTYRVYRTQNQLAGAVSILAQ
jgi:hypothetical protein